MLIPRVYHYAYRVYGIFRRYYDPIITTVTQLHGTVCEYHKTNIFYRTSFDTILLYTGKVLAVCLPGKVFS